VLLACGAQFDPASQLDGLRAIAVWKSAPYAKPGSTVELQLAWDDTDLRPPPQIAWLALCQNPVGDLFTSCLSELGSALGSAMAPNGAMTAATPGTLPLDRVSLPRPDAAAANDHFSFTTAPDIISARPPPKDPTVTPYGVDFVIFAACAGTLGRGSDPNSPFICYQEHDGEPGFSAGDSQLGPRDFVVGYTEVFGYDELRNQNPIITGVDLNGIHFEPGAVPTALSDGSPLDSPPLGADDICIGQACGAPDAGADASVCPAALTIDSCSGNCAKLSLNPHVDPASAEIDEAASSGRSSVLLEQMWVNYYAAGGKISDQVRLLNDATLGWNSDYSTKYEPAKEPSVGYVWAVAHDNRGGVEWARLRVCTQ
jgi:hypothetical protein